MNKYYYCLVKSKLKKLKETDKILNLDVPCKIYSFVGIYKGGCSVNGSRKYLANENRDVLAWIHVKQEDKIFIQNYDGYLGDTKDDVLKYEGYTIFYPYKIKDVKRKVLFNGDTIEYEGEDAENQALFFDI